MKTLKAIALVSITFAACVIFWALVFLATDEHFENKLLDTQEGFCAYEEKIKGGCDYGGLDR